MREHAEKQLQEEQKIRGKCIFFSLPPFPLFTDLQTLSFYRSPFRFRIDRFRFCNLYFCLFFLFPPSFFNIRFMIFNIFFLFFPFKQSFTKNVSRKNDVIDENWRASYTEQYHHSLPQPVLLCRAVNLNHYRHQAHQPEHVPYLH